MIGPKEPSAIREELRQRLAAEGTDPLRWLEECVATGRRAGAEDGGGDAVIDSLRRILEPPENRERGRPRTRAKK